MDQDPPEPQEPQSTPASPEGGAERPEPADGTSGGVSPGGGDRSSDAPLDQPSDGAADSNPAERPKRRRRRRKPRGGTAGAPGEGASEAPSEGVAPAEGSDREPGRHGRSRRQPKGGSKGEGGRRAPRGGTPRGSTPRGSGPTGAPARNRQARTDRNTRNRPRDNRSQGELSLGAVEALSQLARQLMLMEGVDHLAMPREVELKLQIPLEDRKGKHTRAANKVVEQIVARVQEVREHERALVPGAVYCYFSDSASADTSRPDDPRKVFEGYSSTGRPEFTDFLTLAVERGVEGVEALAKDAETKGADALVAFPTMGRVLRTAQLAEFGKKSPIYRILGQVNVGLFPLIDKRGTDGKAAFSFQLLRGSTLEGRPRLRVHPVGGADLRDIADPGVLHLLSRFQRKLDEQSLRLAGAINRGEEVDEEEFALPLLQELAKQLTGRARRQSNRTDHANQRSEEGARPTSSAWSDADGVPDDRLLWDDSQQTVVIVAPKGRVHVFTPDARHVTSLMLTGAQVASRKSQRRWRLAEPEERGEFRIALQRRRRTGTEEGVDGEAPPA